MATDEERTLVRQACELAKKLNRTLSELRSFQIDVRAEISADGNNILLEFTKTEQVYP